MAAYTWVGGNEYDGNTNTQVCGEITGTNTITNTNTKRHKHKHYHGHKYDLNPISTAEKMPVASSYTTTNEHIYLTQYG